MMNPRSQSSQQLSKKIHALTEDRLSNLPKNVIEGILLCMPLRDAVRTSILSSIWRYEWSYLPGLVFDQVNIPPHEDESITKYHRKFVKIVDHVLLLHRGPIHKFTLSIKLESIDIDRWILYVSRNGIRELSLLKWNHQILYKVPSCMFSCKDITYLSLCGCSLIHLASFSGFCNLRTLKLWGVRLSNSGLVNLLSNNPLLKKLSLWYIFDCTHVMLLSPNLVDLQVEGTFQDICFEKTPVLAKASFNLKSDGEYKSLANGSTCKLVKLFGCLPSIGELKLIGDTLKILSAAGEVPPRLPSPCQILHLCIRINFESTQEKLAALCIFRSSSFLQKVDMESISNKNVEISVEDFWEAQEDLNCLFGQLQIITVTEYSGTMAELKFIEFVLANAPVLEMVKIKLKINVADANKILKELARLRRISSKAELIFPEEDKDEDADV